MTKAKELIFMGETMEANTALALGLVNKVVPVGNLMAEAKEFAGKLLGKSGVTLSMAKKAINTGAEIDLASGLDLEGQCFALCFATEDQKVGTKAFQETKTSIQKENRKMIENGG